MTSATKKIPHYGKELLHELKHKHHMELPPVNGRAEKAQAAVKAYKKAGGGYSGAKKSKTPYLNGQNKNGVQSQEKNHQRQEKDIYLKKLLSHYLSKEYARTTAKKRRDKAAGKQFSKQPKSIASEN